MAKSPTVNRIGVSSKLTDIPTPLLGTWAHGGGGALLAGSSGRGLICDVYWLGGRVGYTGHVILPNTGRGVEISRP